MHQDKNKKPERPQKTVSHSAYNNPILRQKIRPMYSRAVSNKPNNILILSDSMLITLYAWGNLIIT